MASKKEFAEFVAEQLGDAGTITYRKMFGEYGLYCDGKYFAAVCDDRLFVNIGIREPNTIGF
ncbi:MAG: TfoX/Sxy family protein [Oscillospiraceae bacterium]